MTAGHFIFIPAVLLVGIVVGWVLGSRAARDAYAAELRRREERQKKRELRTENEAQVHRPTANRCANTSGSPASTILACAFSTGYCSLNSSTARAAVSTIA